MKFRIYLESTADVLQFKQLCKYHIGRFKRRGKVELARSTRVQRIIEELMWLPAIDELESDLPYGIIEEQRQEELWDLVDTHMIAFVKLLWDYYDSLSKSSEFELEKWLEQYIKSKAKVKSIMNYIRKIAR